MADGTVRGVFELSVDQPLRGMRNLRSSARELDVSLASVGRTMDSLGGPTSTLRLSAYEERLRGVGRTAQDTAVRVSSSWDAQRRAVEDQSRRIEVRVDRLDERLKRFGRTRAQAEVGLKGFDRVNAQIVELERRLDRLSRQRATPSVGLTGGFSNMGGGGSGLTSAAGGGGGSGGFGAAAKLALTGAALLPGAQALGGAATALLGSASGATLGAATIGGGALATLGVGAGLTLVIAKPAIKELQELDKMQKKYTETVERYGAASKQAAKERELLVLAQRRSAGADVAAREFELFKRDWRSATTPARRSFFGALSNIAVAGRHAMPTLARSTNIVTAASGGAVSNFAGFLAGNQTQRTVMGLSEQYARDLPIAERSLQNITSTLEHLALAARPFFHEANLWVQTWTHGLASSTANEARVQHTMHGFVEETKDWGRLAGATFKTVHDIFNMGRPAGDSMVVELTRTLDRWDAWIQRNPAKVRNFFEEARTTTKEIGSALVSITKLLSQAATILTPIFSRGVSLIGLLSRLGPLGAAGAGSLLYGAYNGIRGGRGPSAGSLLASGVLGRPVGLGGGSRAAGGLVVGPTASMVARASNLEAARGVTSSGTFLMGPATIGIPAVLARRQAATAATIAERESGGILSAARDALMLTRTRAMIGNAAGFTSDVIRGGGMARAAAMAGGMDALGGVGSTVGAGLAGAGRMYLPIAGIMGALQAASFEGGVGGRLQAGLSGATAGLIKMPDTASQTQAKVYERVNKIQETLPQGMDKRSQAEAVRRLQLAIHSGGDVFIGTNANTEQEEEGNRKLKQILAERLKIYRDYATAHNKELTVAAESHAQRLVGELPRAFTIETQHGRSPQRAVADIAKDMLGHFKSLGREGSRTLAEGTLQWARTVEKANPKLTGIVGDLRNQIERHFHGMNDNLAIINGHILFRSTATWNKLAEDLGGAAEKAHRRAGGAFDALQREALAELQLFGFSPSAAAALVRAGPAAAGKAEGEMQAAQRLPKGFFRGAGEVIVNKSAEQRHARGGMIGGKGLLDTVDVPGGKAAPGEAWIANRHTMYELSRATVEKYGKTAQQMIQGETRPHSSPTRYAMGGRIVTASEFGGPADPGSSGRTASGKVNSAGLVGWAELSNPPGSLNFAALGHLPMGTMLPITYNNRTITAPKVDVGAGGAGIGGHIRAIDLTYGLARMFGWGPSDMHNVIVGDPAGIGLGAGAGSAARRLRLRARRSGLRGIPGALADRASLLYAAALQQHVNSRLPSSSASVAGGIPNVGGVSGPKGLGSFDGLQVADWIVPELNYARAHGWRGHITSGYRPGFDPHAPGGSEHALTQYPGGAVDFGGYNEGANREAFERAVAGYRGRRLIAAQGFHDLGHMSGTGHQRGGRVSGGASPQTELDKIWKALSGQRALPATAHEPRVTVFAGTGTDFVDPANRGVIHISNLDRFLLTNPRPENSRERVAIDTAHSHLVHELAHTMQKGLRTKWEAEGGAQAWADEWAPRIFGDGYRNRGDGRYASFVQEVRGRKGENWIDHLQFGHQRGGRATWAGWHAKGGEYETRGPVIFGAGEGGKKERVSITPLNSSGTHGAHSIMVNIDKLVLQSGERSEIEKIAKQVAGAIVDELDAVGVGPSDRELVGR